MPKIWIALGSLEYENDEFISAHFTQMGAAIAASSWSQKYGEDAKAIPIEVQP